MKHAILIIAHKNLEQLVHLIQSLEHNCIDVYVHIDKKWKLNDDGFQKIQEAGPNCQICKKRLSGFLDTWSLCQIAIELMKEAKANGEYGYYYLLSGQDYPIKPIPYIVDYLDKNYPRPIIDCTPMRKDNWIYSGFKWIRFHSYYRLVERITQNRAMRKALLLPAYAVQYIVTKVVGSPYKKLQKAGCDLYGGSAWWALPNTIVDLVIQEVEHNTDIVRAFKIKNTPEETFFQTMAMRSELRDQISLNDPYEVLQNCMTYAYFFDENHEATGHPYALTMDNYQMLRERKELFARKFDVQSEELIERIDRDILGV